MAFDPIQKVIASFLRGLAPDNIPLTGAAVERPDGQFTRNPAPLIVHDPRPRRTCLIAKVVEAVIYRIPFILTIPRQSRKRPLPNMLRRAAAPGTTGTPSAC